MPESSRFSDDRLDSLVRSYLEDDSRRVDTAANLRAVKERFARAQKEEIISLRRQVIRKRVRWVMSIAALLLVGAGTAYLVFDPTPTSAYSIMSAASEAITPGADRCYRIDVEARAKRFKRHPILRNINGSLVWTRGDRFWLSPDGANGKLIMGQDERRKVWVVCSKDLGLLYNPGEVPQMLASVRSVLNLDVEKLTKQFLEQYSFEFEAAGPGDAPGTVILRATAKPDRPQLPIDSARITVERRTNVIRKMELSRVVDGEPLGTITFALVDVAPQADSRYQLKDHLDAGAEILSRNRADERAEALGLLLAP